MIGIKIKSAFDYCELCTFRNALTAGCGYLNQQQVSDHKVEQNGVCKFMSNIMPLLVQTLVITRYVMRVLLVFPS